MREKKQMILSLSDSVQLFKKLGFLIVTGSFLCGCAVFFYFLLKPVHFTAEGVFNVHVTSQAPWKSALEFFEKREITPSAQDNASLMKSYPVLQATVRHLGLQATLTEARLGARLQEIYYTLKSAKAYTRLRKEQPPSTILSRGVYTSSSPIIPTKKSFPTMQGGELHLCHFPFFKDLFP